MKKWLLLAGSLVILVLGTVVLLGAFHHADAPAGGPSESKTSATDDVRALIDFTTPANWQTATCPDNGMRLYLVSSGSAIDCAVDPPAPFSMLVDPRVTTNCQQVTAPNGVLGHTCKSVMIDNHPALQVVTEYPKSDMYPKAETDSYYFVDTGNGVVQLGYVYGAKGTNTYQSQFDQLAQSIKVK